MKRQHSTRTSVSAMMGTTVLDGSGKPLGKVREFAVVPQADATRVEGLVLKKAGSARGDVPLIVRVSALAREDGGQLRLAEAGEGATMPLSNDYLMLERDLLDNQIIDMNGHKVVRVNDVDLVWERQAAVGGSGKAAEDFELVLRIAEVEIGTRGAVRRLLKGLPQGFVNGVACKAGASAIPWDFVDLIDRDPSRRVRLKIEQEQLNKMHPSDLADILEELAPPERHALFSSLEEDVAAETLEEVELKTQMTLIESLDDERAAGIIEEMDPGAAADLLSELPDERSDAILEEMNDRERHEMEELLEHSSDSAAGIMTTDFVALLESGTAKDAREELAAWDGDVETITDVFLYDEDRHFAGLVPLGKLLLAAPDAPLRLMHEGHMVSSGLEANGKKVAELFDKYNLRCLPVLDAERRIAGVIHGEHVIAWLRTQ